MEPDEPGSESPKEGLAMLPFIGWCVLLAALLVWEAFGLRAPHDSWPTFSDMLHSITRHLIGRWVLFGVWLWVGFHLFVRGWKFFLRG